MNSLLRATLLLLVTTSSIWAQPVGSILVCKVGTPDEYDVAMWQREVVVPTGMLFGDVGTIDDPATEWLRLRIETLAPARLSGSTRCVTVPGRLWLRDDDYGRKHVGSVVTRIGPEARRLLEVVKMADPAAPVPDRMGPWAIDLMTVEATIASAFR